MDVLQCSDPAVKRMALAALEECCEPQAFERRVLETMLNAAMSAKVGEACNTAYGERDPERSNSSNATGTARAGSSRRQESSPCASPSFGRLVSYGDIISK